MAGSHEDHIPLGNTAAIKESARDLWRFNPIENLWRDLIYAARGLRRSPALLICALLSLGLGIGANTAIFQLLDAVRLRSLPVRNPQELAAVRIIGGNRGIGITESAYADLTRPVWEEIQRRQEAFSGMFAWSADRVNIGQGSALRSAKAMWVSGDFFRVLGVSPWQGRLILPEDVGACPESTAVVGYAYWQREMGGRPIGGHTTLLVDGNLKQVIGVTPPVFFWPVRWRQL